MIRPESIGQATRIIHQLEAQVKELEAEVWMWKKLWMKESEENEIHESKIDDTKASS